MAERRRGRPRALTLGAMMLLSLAAAACGSPATDDSTAEQGDANTRLTGEFETIDGAAISLEEFHSEDLVLWMWAPW